MSRKYFEEVSAKMIRIQTADEIFLLRQPTEIHFGSGTELIGSVTMTNPGGFEFNKTVGWAGFKTGMTGSSNVFEAIDYPDTTMQNVIAVIRAGFEQAGLGYPSGIVRIHNVSNVRQPDKEQAETYHNRVKVALKEQAVVLELLEDPVTNSKDSFWRACDQSQFVIMGFVNNVFEDRVTDLVSWSEEKKSKVISAIDNKGRVSHPRRWRAEPYLKEQAIQSLLTLLRTREVAIIR